jgi:hypothetical protein
MTVRCEAEAYAAKWMARYERGAARYSCNPSRAPVGCLLAPGRADRASPIVGRLIRNGQNDPMLVRISHSHWGEEELILLMNSLEQSLGSRTRPACGSTGAFQCLLRVGTGQRVSFVMQFEWLVRPLAYDFGQIVR